VAKEANDSTFDDRKEEKDADFIVNAVASNLAEIKIAQLANNKSSDKAVKDMAKELEKDHTKILNELKAYAGKNGIAVPLQEDESDAKEMNKLAEESADKFDEKWCESMEDRHQKSINNFESRMDKTEDPELKNWISSTLPGLKHHLDMLKTHDKVDGE
jgi:putative membrane protein